MRSNRLIWLPSCRLHGAHSPQIQRQAHELELGLNTVQPAQAELTEPQHTLDPAVGRLGDPLALAVRRLACLGLQLGGHGRGVGGLLRIDFGAALALASHGHHQFRA